MKIFLFIAIYSLIITNLFSQEISSDEKNILVYQDTRTLGPNKELLNYLKSTDDKIVIKALYALANISDLTTVDEIGRILKSGANPKAKEMAAFALGQIPCEKSLDILTSSLNSEKEINVLKFIVESIGKTGTAESLHLVTGLNYENPEMNESIALSIARFAIRGIKGDAGINKLKEMLKINPEKALEEKIAYALYRTRSKELLTPVHKEILNLSASMNENTRMWAFSALGFITDPLDISYVCDVYMIESSWMVKVNILNSFYNYNKADGFVINQKIIDCLYSSFDDSNPNVRITGIKLTGLLFSNLKTESKFLQTIKNKLEWYLKPDIAAGWRDIGEAINSYGMIFKDSVKNVLLQKYFETENFDLKPFIVRAFKYFDNAAVWRELTDTISADIQRYNQTHLPKDEEMIQSKELGNIYASYVEVLTELYKKANDTTKGTLRILVSAFIDSKDPVITDLIVQFINSDTALTDPQKYMKELLKMDYSELSYPQDKEVIMLLINEFGELKLNTAIDILKKNLSSEDYDICKASADALEKITGKKFSFKTKQRTDFDWKFIGSLSKKYAVIKTEYGNIKIKFLTDIAPFTIQNFIKLAQKKFYDGTVFHRVVPDFVIQGGDPLNNGWGGCGYSIRSEFSPVYYERGIVGMASDGKDTEGSQFFIMHCPHYHLDGRYTVFGEVTEGMDIVDKIWIGDKVISLEILE